MKLTPIPQLQGPSFDSPYTNEQVRTSGTVTGFTRKGFFIQQARDGSPDHSQAIFVFTRRHHPPVGALVEVQGKVHDYRVNETDRPTTQLAARYVKVLRKRGPRIDPIPLDASVLHGDTAELSLRLNSLEGMLVSLAAGSTFVAPSNPFGDYVVLPPDVEAPRTPHDGALIDPDDPHRWFPSFRITNYDRAPRLNVGSRLKKSIVGPLNYRAQAYQVSVPMVDGFRLEFEAREHDLPPTSLTSDPAHLTIFTLNGFNLDPQVERADLVHDPGRDVDDDIGDGRYLALGVDVVRRGLNPDIIALQEIQDDDGAEITDTVDATRNYRELAQAIAIAGGPAYTAADLPPVAGADGGQPGGNIRNGFLYDPTRVELIEGTLERLGESDPAFVDSRKPLVAHFRHLASGARLAVFNLHLASKRHQHPIFSPDRPGFDPRDEQRVAQARAVRSAVLDLRREGIDYYVTGDFNDYEFSATLRELLGEESVNLVDALPANERYDYNHRGTSEALLHAVVPKERADQAEYEVLHGNELNGVQPGSTGDRATDHAYGVMRIRVGS